MATGGTQTRRVILVGKSGNGKSSTGNAILEELAFLTKQSLNSVTQQCQRRSHFRPDVELEYEVVDTPGLFDTNVPFARRALDIQKALDECPNPHVFLLILRPDARYTEEEKLTIDMLRVVFGEEFMKHTILVFTRGSDYKSDEDLDSFLKESEVVINLKNECGNRVARVENNALVDAGTRGKLLGKLFHMIEKMTDGGKNFYSYSSLSIHRTILEEHLTNRTPGVALNDELSQLVEEIGAQLRRERWRAYLVGGLAGAGVVGVVYAAPAAPALVGALKGATGAALGYATGLAAHVGPRAYISTVTAWSAGASLAGNMLNRCGF